MFDELEKVVVSMTFCESCPCINNDYESGAECALGYMLGIYKTHKDQGIPLGMIYASEDCGLEFIKHKDGEYRPVKILVEK